MEDSEKPKKKRRVAAAAAADTSPDPPPDLPESFKEWIQRLGGSNPVLVIQKRLYSTDVSKQQNRLSIPLSAVRTEFLKDHERQLLDGRLEKRRCKELKPTILEGSGVERTISLRKWDMSKTEKKGNRSAGAGSMTYNLCAPWCDMVELHGWEAGDLIQLWAFRIGEDLGLAVVNLDENSPRLAV